MFALAIWTESEKRLLLARDRMGIKPLYYLRRGDEISTSAPKLKAILAHPEVERRINPIGPELLPEPELRPRPLHAGRGHREAAAGPLAGVARRLGRDRRLTGSSSSSRGTTWTLEDAKEELDALLTASVREHLISDVPLGVWASGGLDSSTILHYAAQQAPGRLKTFSVSFRGRSFDESRYFRQVARALRDGPPRIRSEPRDRPERRPSKTWPNYADEPSADAGALPVWFLSKCAASHVTVALSGEGADELFGGYVTYRADQLAGRLRLVPAAARRAALGAAAALAGLRREDQLRVQAQAVPGRLSAGARRGPRLLERRLQRSGEARPPVHIRARARSAFSFEYLPADDGFWHRAGPLSVVRSALLPCRTTSSTSATA